MRWKLNNVNDFNKAQHERNVGDLGCRGKYFNSIELKHYCSWQKGLISPLPLSTSSFTSLLAIVPAPFLQPSVILKSFCEPIHMANSKEISRFRVEFFSVFAFLLGYSSVGLSCGTASPTSTARSTSWVMQVCWRVRTPFQWHQSVRSEIVVYAENQSPVMRIPIEVFLTCHIFLTSHWMMQSWRLLLNSDGIFPLQNTPRNLSQVA